MTILGGHLVHSIKIYIYVYIYLNIAYSHCWIIVIHEGQKGESTVLNTIELKVKTRCNILLTKFQYQRPQFPHVSFSSGEEHLKLVLCYFLYVVFPSDLAAVPNWRGFKQVSLLTISFEPMEGFWLAPRFCRILQLSPPLWTQVFKAQADTRKQPFPSASKA